MRFRTLPQAERPQQLQGPALLGAVILAAMAAPRIRGRFIDWQAPSIDALFPGMLGWQNRQKIDLARLGVFEVHRRGNWAAWQIDPTYCGEPFNPEGEWPKDPDLAGFLLSLNPEVAAAAEGMPPEDRTPERVGAAALAALPRPGQPQQQPMQAEGKALAGDRGSPPALESLGSSERKLLWVILKHGVRPLTADALHAKANTGGWEQACEALGEPREHQARSVPQLKKLVNTLEACGLITRKGDRGGWFRTAEQAEQGWALLGCKP